MKSLCCHTIRVQLREEKDLTAVRVVCVDGRRVDSDRVPSGGGGSEELVAKLVPDELLTASHGCEPLETALAGHLVAEHASGRVLLHSLYCKGVTGPASSCRLTTKVHITGRK